MAGIVTTYDDTTLLANVAVIDTVVDDIETDVAAVQSTVDDIQSTVDDIEADVAAVQTTVDAIPTLTETGGTLTADVTEQNLYINNAPAGVYRPICVKVDFTNHTGTETVKLRIYYRIASGGDLIKQDEVEYVGVPTVPLINIALEPNRYGVKVTLEKTAGTNRNYPWEAAYEV